MIRFKFLLVILFGFYMNVGFSQLSAVGHKSTDYIQFKASTTYLVTTGNVSFDARAKYSMENFWTATPFEIISPGEFEKKLSDPTASFLMPVVVSGDKTYHYLALFNGGKKKIWKYKYTDMLAYCPINHYQNEPNLTDCSFRVKNMIQSMAQAMDSVKDNKISGNSLSIVKRLQKKYNDKASKIKEKTLLFCKETVVGLSKSDIAKIYPYKFEICSQKKIEEIITEKTEGYYYFQPGITVNKSMFVFDPVSGEVVYFTFKIQGTKIKTSDIKKLVETIKK